MEGSLREFLHIAQVSAHISQDHIVTAFHFLISNLIVAPAAPVLLAGAEAVSSILVSSSVPSLFKFPSLSAIVSLFIYFFLLEFVDFLFLSLVLDYSFLL